MEYSYYGLYQYYGLKTSLFYAFIPQISKIVTYTIQAK